MDKIEIPFQAEGPLKPFTKAYLTKAAEDELKENISDIGREVLIVKKSEANAYYAQLVKLTHTNILHPLMILELPEDEYSCICFEDHFACLFELSNLLFDNEADERCDMSELCRGFIYKIARALEFLHENGCYHGSLNAMTTYLTELHTDLPDASFMCEVKIACIQGLLGLDVSNKVAQDWSDFGDLIADIFKKNNMSPNHSVESYINKLKGKNAMYFAFNHPIWMTYDRKICLLLEIEANPKYHKVSLLLCEYWPKNDRLKELIQKEVNYVPSIKNFIQLLWNKYQNQISSGSCQESRSNFILFLEEIEKHDPDIWIKILETRGIVLKITGPEDDYKDWLNGLYETATTNVDSGATFRNSVEFY